MLCSREFLFADGIIKLSIGREIRRGLSRCDRRASEDSFADVIEQRMSGALGVGLVARSAAR